MQINITICIQMVQFLIAYWFLYRYIFVPACAIIEKEDVAIHSLENKISTLQNLMIEQEANNKKIWQTIQSNLLEIVSEQSNVVQSKKGYDSIDLPDSPCELHDAEVEKGQKFLQEQILKLDEVKQ